ncbi:uncharacterized protein B0P05DRAFT_530287 [Gilbertella persicaria]|uniref:uncharacterized protein n=1 Tax=Gilbertella persicaria TaxID=101096 RepID=UPI00221EFCA1|nr:uncharacterized protein B0P05DRAFT_530287 [Gilbertella persicaria]KAI8090315.1 hypothetical protein B0P05DRAFT_530287 [Gilbertella persicaria]
MAEVDNDHISSEEDVFQPELPLVEDCNREYVYQLNEDDVTNDTIEKMYGPFDSWQLDSGPSTPTRPFKKLTKSVHDQKLEEIEKLKRDIREKEAQHKQALERRQALEKELALDRLKDLEEAEKQQEADKQQANEMVSDLEVVNLLEDNDTSSVQDTKLNSIQELSINSEDNTDAESFASAEDYLPEDDQMETLDQEIKRLEDQLQQVRDEQKQIQVKVLAMKVRLSIENNRKELVKPNKKSEEPAPELGTKRSPSSKSSNKKKKRAIEDTMSSYNSFSTPLPNFGYQLPLYFNQAQSRQPFYPHPNTFMFPSPYHHPIQHMASSLPPPPPPSDLPPPSSPPPPPPPPLPAPSSHIITPRSISTPNTPYAAIAHCDSHRVKAYESTLSTLREFEQLISMRIFHSNQENFPPVSLYRPPPRPRRLITVDNYTMTINMFFLNQVSFPFQIMQLTYDKESDTEQQAQQKNQEFILPAGQPVQVELTDLTYESPLFIMLYRKAEHKKFDEKIMTAVNATILCIPPEIDLSTFHVRHAFGLPLHPERLLVVYQLVKAFCEDYEDKEFLGALKLELSMYVNGPSSEQFKDDFETTKKQFPLSVDVHWQGILSETTFVAQLALIKSLLSDIYKSHGTFDSLESTIASARTVEVLTRLIRLNGLGEVLKMMTGNDNFTIATDTYSTFSLTDTPGLYLLHNDRYYMWTLILYYYVMHSLPQGVCETWMNTLVKEGNPQMTKPLFMIDWTEALKNDPLDKSTLFGSINILLSMWNHFAQLACSDTRKKPLLIGALRTLVTLLIHTAQYKIPGTLLLVNKLAQIKLLEPELREIEINLENKRHEDPKSLIHSLSTIDLPRPQLLALAYRCVCLFSERVSHTVGYYTYIACILSLPLAKVKTDKDALLMFVDTNNAEQIQDEHRIKLMYSLIDQYKNLVGLTDADPKTEKETSFAWINLLSLIKVLKTIQPDKREELHEEMKTVFDKGFSLIQEQDGRLLFFKYATALLTENQ